MHRLPVDDALILPATDDMLKYLSENLREQDARELLAVEPDKTLYEILIGSALKSDPHTFCGFWKGVPVCAFGVAPAPPHPDQPGVKVGIPWLVATEHIHDSARRVLVYTQYWVAWMQTQYGILMNMCSTDNDVSIDWLTSAGFLFNWHDIRQENGVDFVPFWRMDEIVPDDS